MDSLGSYNEARINLPRCEKNLPILTQAESGRGYRKNRKKSTRLPGESTTEAESSGAENSKQPHPPKRKSLQTRGNVKENAAPKLSASMSIPPPPESLQSGGSNKKKHEKQ